MRIMDFLNKKAVVADLKSKEKKDIIEELLDALIEGGSLKKSQKQAAVQALMNREELGSTGIGQGIGVPHAKLPDLKELIGAFGLSRNGVDFESLDGDMVYIFFLILAPEESAGPHLKALARLSRLLKDKFFRDMLKNAKDAKEIVKIISDEDQRR
ncbi:MAG: PTS sugar transporter subunit IIA [Candidatus Omnitrophica bacterium]|nr:PTS sugar transporter subunit IIA [Candidatus Omnitrophota bacterium]